MGDFYVITPGIAVYGVHLLKPIKYVLTFDPYNLEPMQAELFTDPLPQ